MNGCNGLKLHAGCRAQAQDVTQEEKQPLPVPRSCSLLPGTMGSSSIRKDSWWSQTAVFSSNHVALVDKSKSFFAGKLPLIKCGRKARVNDNYHSAMSS